jgi:hypothetical protein
MKIYQKLTIIDGNRIYSDLIGLPFRIESAQLLSSPYGNYNTPNKNNKHSIIFGLRKIIGGKNDCSYGFVIKENKKQFLSDMRIKDGKIENLVGKKIIGFLNSKEMLEGIGIWGS